MNQDYLTNTDKLPILIQELALYPQEKWGDKIVGRSETIQGNNSLLYEIYKEIEELRWLKEMSVHLFCRTQRIQRTGKSLTEFSYIPIPGFKNGQRVKHPCEILQKNGIETALTQAPDYRSRELAWVIPYKTSTGIKNMLFVFTFDPLIEIIIRTNNEEWEKFSQYWKKAALNQNLIKPGENIGCLHAFTGLHEWMNIVETNDGEKTPHSWKRQFIEPIEAQHACATGLDIYYSNNIVCYAWSTLEKQKSRERARTLLQQNISKKVILFDPIYGNTQGIKSTKKEEHLNFLLPENNERDKTAKSFWEGVITNAYENRASDIHIEPLQSIGKSGCDLIVSIRKDAQLEFFTKIPSSIAEDFARHALETSGVIRRENKRPQDGRRSWVHPQTKEAIDLRISITPSGTPIQKIVMRLLDSNKLKRGISDIGLEPEEIIIWEKGLTLNEGLVLVSGPTGSGKSSTLYAALITIFERDNKRSFSTFEDPVEYRLPFRAVQTPVDPDNGSSYEQLIRQAMRNDGDTILIGEIRDKITASAALQLSLTGTQILSSIHANSAAETALRLLELGVDPYMLSESLRMVVSQRLIPTCCPSCKKEISEQEISPFLRKYGGEILLETLGPLWEKKYKRKAHWILGEGCHQCRFSGKSGMIAAQEFLIIDQKNKKYLKDGNIQKLQESMKERSFLTMEEIVWKFAWLGKIPIDQAGELTNQLKNA